MTPLLRIDHPKLPCQPCASHAIATLQTPRFEVPREHDNKNHPRSIIFFSPSHGALQCRTKMDFGETIAAALKHITLNTGLHKARETVDVWIELWKQEGEENLEEVREEAYKFIEDCLKDQHAAHSA